jgi:hypothetical protein
METFGERGEYWKRGDNVIHVIGTFTRYLMMLLCRFFFFFFATCMAPLTLPADIVVPPDIVCFALGWMATMSSQRT